jgi:hypothetical protein
MHKVSLYDKEMSMPELNWSETIQHAFFDAWAGPEMPDEEIQEIVEAFTRRWGGLEANAFAQALQEGNETDRIWALFALSRLAPLGVEERFVPFLHSLVRKERWASAIALGRKRDERAFAALRELLVEEMEFHPPHADKNLAWTVAEAAEEAGERFGNRADWDRLVEPAFLEAWHEELAYDALYDWHLCHRVTITRLFGTWGDPRAIPVLRQALAHCWRIEQLPAKQGGIPRGGYLKEAWHRLEDELAYALGQLEAWDSLDGLELPPARFKLARMYLVFGSLQVNLRQLYNGDIMRLVHIGTIRSNAVMNVLRERFGLDDSLARAQLTMFQQWYRERDWKHNLVPFDPFEDQG